MISPGFSPHDAHAKNVLMFEFTYNKYINEYNVKYYCSAVDIKKKTKQQEYF